MAGIRGRAPSIERTVGLVALAVVVATALGSGTPESDSSTTAKVAAAERTRTADPSVEPSTTTTEPDLRTLRGFNHYRATAAVPTISVYESPDSTGPVVTELPQVAELGTPQTFLIEREERDAAGNVWYHVLLPTPPNGSVGWIRAQDVLVEGLDLRIEVQLSDFTLRVLDGDEVVRTYAIGVGTVDTPTPGGDYYVKEAYELTRDTSAYGSHALGLNGYSTVLDYWKGGGVIGIHGTNRPDSIGRNASHGCMRMHNDDVAELFELAPRGTPVTIVA